MLARELSDWKSPRRGAGLRHMYYLLEAYCAEDHWVQRQRRNPCENVEDPEAKVSRVPGMFWGHGEK